MNQGTIRFREGGRAVGWLWQGLFLAVVAVAVARGSAHAGVIISGLNGTGVNYSPTVATQDANWQIVALPASGTAGTLGSAWIFTGGGGSNNVPGGWFGGGGNAGSGGNHWIGVRSNNAAALLPDAFTGSYYSVIFSTTFQASAAGTVPFSFDISVDNRATVFVGGSITGTDTDRPTITGGHQIGSLIWNTNPPNGTPRAFQQLQTAAGTASVVQGANTLYVVVDDYISVPNVDPQTYGSIGLLVTNVVPEPSTFLMALAGIGCGGLEWRMVRRRKPRRSAGDSAVVGG